MPINSKIRVSFLIVWAQVSASRFTSDNPICPGTPPVNLEDVSLTFYDDADSFYVTLDCPDSIDIGSTVRTKYKCDVHHYESGVGRWFNEDDAKDVYGQGETPSCDGKLSFKERNEQEPEIPGTDFEATTQKPRLKFCAAFSPPIGSNLHVIGSYLSFERRLEDLSGIHQQVYDHASVTCQNGFEGLYSQRVNCDLEKGEWGTAEPCRRRVTPVKPHAKECMALNSREPSGTMDIGYTIPSRYGGQYRVYPVWKVNGYYSVSNGTQATVVCEKTRSGRSFQKEKVYECRQGHWFPYFDGFCTYPKHEDQVSTCDVPERSAHVYYKQLDEPSNKFIYGSNPSLDPDPIYLPRMPHPRIYSYSAGAQLNFGCSDGRALVGSAVITCLRNGQWRPEPPSCSKSALNDRLFLAVTSISGMLLIMLMSVLAFMLHRRTILRRAARQRQQRASTTVPSRSRRVRLPASSGRVSLRPRAAPAAPAVPASVTTLDAELLALLQYQGETGAPPSYDEALTHSSSQMPQAQLHHSEHQGASNLSNSCGSQLNLLENESESDSEQMVCATEFLEGHANLQSEEHAQLEDVNLDNDAYEEQEDQPDVEEEEEEDEADPDLLQNLPSTGTNIEGDSMELK